MSFEIGFFILSLAGLFLESIEDGIHNRLYWIFFHLWAQKTAPPDYTILKKGASILLLEPLYFDVLQCLTRRPDTILQHFQINRRRHSCPANMSQQEFFLKRYRRWFVVPEFCIECAVVATACFG